MRAEKIYLKAVAAAKSMGIEEGKKGKNVGVGGGGCGGGFTCLSVTLLKCARSFITNWPYGLLSLTARRLIPASPFTTNEYLGEIKNTRGGGRSCSVASVIFPPLEIIISNFTITIF